MGHRPLWLRKRTAPNSNKGSLQMAIESSSLQFAVNVNGNVAGVLLSALPVKPLPKYRRTLRVVIEDVNPGALRCSKYWEGSPTPAMDSYSSAAGASPLDLDIYDPDDPSEAVRIVMALDGPAASFLTGGGAILAGGAGAINYLCNLSYFVQEGLQSVEFYCLLGRLPRGKLREYIIGMQVRGNGYSTNVFYDPKIRNNGEICQEDDPSPECM